MATGNVKNFELKIGKVGLIIFVVGMAFLICTAFLFGIDVGKNIDTYPDKIAALPQKALALIWRPAKMRAAQIASDNKGVPNQPQAQNKENIDLTFYKDLTSKKGIQEQPVADKQPVFSSSANREEAVTGNSNIEAKKSSMLLNEKTKAKGDFIENEIAPNMLSNKQKFKIQVASLKDKATANKMNKKIASLGFMSQVIKTDVQGKGTLYRVVVSGFEDKIQADEAAQKISRQTGTDCVIKSVDSEARKN